MTDAVEPIWQAVQKETADELVRVQRHEPGRVAAAVITPAEGDAGGICADKAAVGDRDPVRVSAQIGKNVFG